MTCTSSTQLHIVTDLERYWLYKARDAIVVLALSAMDSPPTYEASEPTIKLNHLCHTSVSQVGDLLAISAPFGTNLYLLPQGTETVEVDIVGCSPVSVMIGKKVDHKPSIELHVS